MYTSRRNRQSDICGEWAFLKCKLIFANFSWQGAPQVCYYRAGPGLCVVLFGEASCLFLCLMGRPEVGMVTIYRQRLCHSALHVIWGTLGTVTSKRQLCIVQYVRSQLTVKDFSLANLFCSKCQLCDQYTTDKWNTLQSIWHRNHSSNLYPWKPVFSVRVRCARLPVQACI